MIDLTVDGMLKEGGMAESTRFCGEYHLYLPVDGCLCKRVRVIQKVI